MVTPSINGGSSERVLVLAPVHAGISPSLHLCQVKCVFCVVAGVCHRDELKRRSFLSSLDSQSDISNGIVSSVSQKTTSKQI